MSLSERRRLPRFPYHSRATLWVGAADHAGMLMDIALRGSLFAADDRPEFTIGDECILTVYYAGKTAFLTTHGRLAHIQDNLIGIEFVHGGKTLEQSLHRLIDLNLGTSELLNRDIPALLRKSGDAMAR